MQNTQSRADDKLDDEGADSFPASDPPSHTPVDGTKASRDHEQADRHDHEHDFPRGTPSDDRHATETAGAMIHGTHPAETDNRSKS